MFSPNAWIIIQRVYRAANMGVWALGVAFTLFLLFHIPQMRDARATAEARLAQEISEENTFYCEKWGLKAGTHEHVICTMDLVRIREKTEQRIADAMNF
jgi:hypothetical protein